MRPCHVEITKKASNDLAKVPFLLKKNCYTKGVKSSFDITHKKMKCRHQKKLANCKTSVK